MIVVTELVLLARLMSGVADVTVTVFVTVPDTSGACTVIVKNVATPTGSDDVVAVSTLLLSTVIGEPGPAAPLQPGPRALMNVSPAGNGSVTTTWFAVAPVRFETVTVY